MLEPWLLPVVEATARSSVFVLMNSRNMGDIDQTSLPSMTIAALSLEGSTTTAISVPKNETLGCFATLLGLYSIVAVVSLVAASFAFLSRATGLKGLHWYFFTFFLFSALRCAQWGIDIKNGATSDNDSSRPEEAFLQLANAVAIALFFAVKSVVVFFWAYAVQSPTAPSRRQLRRRLISICVVANLSLTALLLITTIALIAQGIYNSGRVVFHDLNATVNIIAATWSIVAAVCFGVYGVRLHHLVVSGSVDSSRSSSARRKASASILLQLVVLISIFSFVCRAVINILYASWPLFYNAYQRNYAAYELVEYFIVEITPSLWIILSLVLQIRRFRGRANHTLLLGPGESSGAPPPPFYLYPSQPLAYRVQTVTTSWCL
mmetsp:Transcript_53999/g.117462  ORF Transcript_53999/g.117462 Transcript_53999/m.117462 type:complete len:378 (+) Transcript_53999:3-1136(+)